MIVYELIMVYYKQINANDQLLEEGVGTQINLHKVGVRLTTDTAEGREVEVK